MRFRHLVDRRGDESRNRTVNRRPRMLQKSLHQVERYRKGQARAAVQGAGVFGVVGPCGDLEAFGFGSGEVLGVGKKQPPSCAQWG